MKEDEIISYSYRFIFSNKVERVIKIDLDKDSLTLDIEGQFDKPDWTKSEYFTCKTPGCGIDNEGHCPIALILNRLIRLFNNLPSYEKVNIVVESEQRIYTKEVSLQEAFGSLLGIIMPTCGCPVLGKLKPLVKYHLPFASIDETEFRVFSMYLLAQFIRMKNGKDSDWEMKNLKQLYTDIQKINKNLVQKIADLEKMDASINSVIVLNNFADSVSFSLEEDLNQFEKLFDCWLKD